MSLVCQRGQCSAKIVVREGHHLMLETHGIITTHKPQMIDRATDKIIEAHN